MKKQNFLTMAVLVAIFGLASCGQSTGVKKVTLKNQADSLNYALGFTNGDGIINSPEFSKDSTDQDIAVLVKAVDKAFNDKNTDELYKLGLQIGTSMKQQKKTGLMNDSTLKLDVNLVKQAMVNAMKGSTEGMTSEQAMQYLQTTMQKIQQSRLQQPMPAPAQSAAPADTLKK